MSRGSPPPITKALQCSNGGICSVRKQPAAKLLLSVLSDPCEFAGKPNDRAIALPIQNSRRALQRSITRRAKENHMNLDYALDRLYDVGWLPSMEIELETAPDGR